jgi:hypothetical protein
VPAGPWRAPPSKRRLPRPAARPRAPAPQEWLREWRVETFAGLGSFNAAELANAAFALATWREPPSDVWLARWAQAMRQRWGTRGACPPPALVRAAYALAAMPPAVPTPATQLLAAARQRGAAASVDGGGGGSGVGGAGAPPPPPPPLEPLPSFNWMCGFLGAARPALDALAPGELAALLWALARLGHAPDAAFADAWYRAAAARARAFGPAELALALHALGTLRPGVGVPGGVPGRFAAELLPAARRLLGACTGPQLAQLLWGLAELRLWPGRGWLDDWLAGGLPRARRAGRRGGSGGAGPLLGRRSGPFCAFAAQSSPGGRAAWRPIPKAVPRATVRGLPAAANTCTRWCYAAACTAAPCGFVYPPPPLPPPSPNTRTAALEPQLAGLDGPSLADAAWGLARMGAPVPSPWLGSLVAAVDARLAEAGGAAARPEAVMAAEVGADAAGGVQAPAAAAAARPGPLGFGGSALVERAAAQARGIATAAAAAEDDGAPAGPIAATASGGGGGAGGGVDARCLAVLVWALARLGHRPPRSWLVAFKAASEEQLGVDAARRAARFIASALLRQQPGGRGEGRPGPPRPARGGPAGAVASGPLL